MPGGEFQEKVNTNNISLKSPFHEIEHYFEKSEIVFVNFECPIVKGSEIRKDKSSILGCSPQRISILKELHVNVACLANNHIHDYGQEGVRHTIEVFKNNNVYPLGVFSLSDNIKNYVTIERNSRKIGFIAFTSNEPWVRSILADSENYGCLFYSKKNIRDGIGALKNDCDLVIVSLHWGFERHEYPSPYQREMAYYCLDQGADIVIGHHPHLVHGYEVYKGKHIFYSLGNFFVSDFKYKDGNWHRYKIQNRYALLVEVDFKDRSHYFINLIPTYQQDDYQIRELINKENEMFFLHLNSISAKFNISKKKYKIFWLKYHFLIVGKAFTKSIRSIVRSRNWKLEDRLKGTIKLTFQLLIELIRRLLYIEPEKKRNYE